MNKEIKPTNHLELKKARVPLKSCLKMSFKNLWKKKIRYLVMFIICGLSLAFLSITIELNGDKLRQNIYTMVENGYNYTEIFKRVESSKEDIKNDYYNKYSSTALDPESYNKIKKELPELIVHQYANSEIKYAGQNMENKNFFYTGIIEHILKYDTTNTYNLICGRLPREDKKEILITDYLYSAFKYFDLYPNIDSITDILNQRINLRHENNYTIVGVVKTNYERWSHFATLDQINVSDKDNYSYTNDAKIMNSVIIPEKYFIIEQSKDINRIKFSKTDNSHNLGTWSVRSNTTNQIVTNDSTTSLTSENIKLSSLDLNNNPDNPFYFDLGRLPISDDEIVIPYTWINDLFSTNENNMKWNNTNSNTWHNISRFFYWFDNYINNQKITLTLTNPQGKTYQKAYTVVGITQEVSPIATCQMTSSEIKTIYSLLNDFSEKIFVELPSNPSNAYKLFNKAYKKGYILNVWAYRHDIDNYVVDPFINIASKAGLFIFAIFTIAIMWTIITIEIVDSSKEIGILRSIGLSGAKVSFIFIFQAGFVCFFSYLLGNFLSWYLIPIYNSGITDELNKITLYMYTYTYRSPIILAVFVISMTLISTIIPLCKIMFKKIIDVINERES